MSNKNYTQQDLANLMRCYEKAMLRMPNSFILEDCVYYLDREIQPEVIEEAFKITAEKGAEFKYTKAILERCVARNIKTLADFKGAKLQKQQPVKAGYDIELFEKMLNEEV